MELTPELTIIMAAIDAETEYAREQVQQATDDLVKAHYRGAELALGFAAKLIRAITEPTPDRAPLVVLGQGDYRTEIYGTPRE